MESPSYLDRPFLDAAAMASSTSVGEEPSSPAKITKISVDKPGFFSTPRGKTVRKILIVAALAIVIAGIASVPPVAAVIPLSLLAIHIISGVLGGVALLTSIIASVVLYKKEQQRPSKQIEIDITDSFCADSREVEEMEGIFTSDTGVRGTKAGGNKETKVFKINGNKIKDKRFIEGDPDKGEEVTADRKSVV